MASLPELEQQLADLREARRSGLKRVVTNERDVTYKSDDDMARAERSLVDEISRIKGRRRRTAILSTYRSGLK